MARLKDGSVVAGSLTVEDTLIADEILSGATGYSFVRVGTHTQNYYPRWSATANSLENGMISDDGATVAISGALSVTSDVRILGTTNYLIIQNNGGQTVDRTLTLSMGDANRTLSLSADLTVSATSTINQDVSTSGTPSFSRVTSSVAIGTAPFTVTSTTEVANLRAATAALASTVSVSSISTDAAHNIVFTDDDVTLGKDGNLTYNPSTNKLQTSEIGVTTISGASSITSTSVTTGNLYLGEDGAPSGYTLRLFNNSGLTANRSLTFNIGDVASRTLTMTGDASISGTNTGDQTTITGNAGSATQLYINNDDTGDTNCPILFTATTTAGNKAVYEDSAVYIDNTNNNIHATGFTGLISTATQGTIDHDSLANYASNEHRQIFVQSTTPTGMANGDIWIDTA